ncbi:ABC transporter ATP-binding protein [Chondromyces apiculatus]|uniref:ABC transporter, ATP-binding protein n=1 Tax=Chondromyces apiculatus DSM 436 TaxID=1192034 RepID=A0A017SYW9_9BACT|nr:ABC transporter ATP-binding protein [Chondromyces apiculatus]EYF01491.1 ABC transporter, ATP-binding protein [Chondromyces apiculatus DSM 436]
MGREGQGAEDTIADPHASDARDARDVHEAAIALRGVTKQFGAVTAVKNVSFEVPSGSVFGLIGPNGAGKTTTFSMMAGYLAPSAGELSLLDRAPRDVDALRGKVGVLPQDALLPPAELVGEYLVFLAQLQGMTRAKATASARATLAEVEGLDWWKVRCGTLSHGMAKRVGLAQAFLGEPRVVLLDEPTAGLDPRVAYGVRRIIGARKGRCTLVISSHNLQELEEICDYAAILDRGSLITHGAMAELTASTSELRIELAQGPVPEDAVRAIEGVKAVAVDFNTREMTVTFDRAVADAEEMIRRACGVLYHHQARISAISKGRRLEQRVMELTDRG